MREASKKVQPWRNAVRTETQAVCQQPVAGPVEAVITFYLPRPKGHYGTGKNAGVLKASAPEFPAGVPDVDKLCRSTLDGLKEGGAYLDDSQVVDLHAVKRYAHGRVPGADIHLSLM